MQNHHLLLKKVKNTGSAHLGVQAFVCRECGAEFSDHSTLRLYRAVGFFKILSDFCSRCRIHLILHLKRPREKYQIPKLKNVWTQNGLFII